MRTRFARCAQVTNTATQHARMNSGTLPHWNMSEATGNMHAATTEPADTRRDKNATTRKLPSMRATTGGYPMAMLPRPVEMPLPPRNPSHGQNTCPAIETMIDSESSRSICHCASMATGTQASKTRTSPTASAPFSTSPANVAAAAFAPNRRAMFVIPIEPEPPSRGSRPKNARPTITPQGIDPSKKDSTTARAKAIG